MGIFAVAREVKDEEGAFRAAESDEEEGVGVGVGMGRLPLFLLVLSPPRGLLPSTLMGVGRCGCCRFRLLFVLGARLREMTRMISQSGSG